MSNILQAVRGMNDILPAETYHWQRLETVIRQVVSSYSYREIRLPLLERTELFKRSIGEVTDIVEKEMYTFSDRNDESVTLRPEGTAGCVRAGIEHSLFYGKSQRLWYMGPMFRYEKPQKGRYRQFYQLGVEAFGIAEPEIDVEILLLSARFWEQLGIKDQVTLQLNSLGSVEARKIYRTELVNYFVQNQSQLDEDSQRRLQTNPLRILDSKNPEMQELIVSAPQLLEYLDEDAQTHFAGVRRLLELAGIEYVINPRLVRGLDYYNKTVFEWVTDKLGAQGTVCAGGRYDGLVEQLGGSATPAVGFAMGLERLVALLEQSNTVESEREADVYFIMVGSQALEKGIVLAEQLRNNLPGLRIVNHCGGGSFKSQFKRADKSGARIALIFGENELASAKIGIKYLREDKPQEIVGLDELDSKLRGIF